MKKECRELESNLGSPVYQTDALEGMAVVDLHFKEQSIFDKLNKIHLKYKIK